MQKEIKMPALESNMLDLGTKLIDFTLYNPLKKSEQTIFELYKNRPMILMFICNHCPYVIHINNKLVETAKIYIDKGVDFIAINSNDIEKYPDDSPAKMIERAEELDYPFPYLFDESQECAKAYKAACTPDFYLFNSNKELVYRGRFDSSTPGNSNPINGADLINAIEAVINNKTINEKQYPSIGCSIKWK